MPGLGADGQNWREIKTVGFLSQIRCGETVQKVAQMLILVRSRFIEPRGRRMPAEPWKIDDK
jgi:hypothetical protein